MAYTCFSKTNLGCGASHRTLGTAKKCCDVHEMKHNELRSPQAISSLNDISDAGPFPASAEARARRDAWRATTTDSRRSYRGGLDHPDRDTAEMIDKPDDSKYVDTAGEMKLPETSQATESNTDAAPDTKSLAERMKARHDEKQQEAKPVDSADPMALMAKALTPHMIDPLAKAIIPAVSEAAAAAVKNATGGDALKAIGDAAKKVTDAMGEKLAVVDTALAELDKARRIEVFTPDSTSGVEVEGAQHENFELLLKLVGAGENVFMSGPAGSGKTTAAATVAKSLGMELIIQPVASDKFDALGFTDAGGTYRESAVYRWATSEKPALLLLDEVDAWLPQALVALNPILDNRIGIFPNGQFEISSKHRVIGTANTWGLGADSEYCGRNRLDAASLDRFPSRLDWGYDATFEGRIVEGQFGKKIADEVLPISHAIRAALQDQGVKIVWGPRQTLGLARRSAAGLDMATAIQVSAMASVPAATRKRVLGEASKKETTLRKALEA